MGAPSAAAAANREFRPIEGISALTLLRLSRKLSYHPLQQRGVVLSDDADDDFGGVVVIVLV